MKFEVHEFKKSIYLYKLTMNIPNDQKKCPNYLICSNLNVDNSYDGICSDCNNLFGKWRNKSHILKIKDTVDICPLCENKNVVICRPS